MTIFDYEIQLSKAALRCLQDWGQQLSQPNAVFDNECMNNIMYVLPTLQANQHKNKQITKNFQDTPKMLNLSEEVSSVKFVFSLLYFGLDFAFCFYITNRQLSTSIFLTRPRPMLSACVAGAWK